MIEKDDFEIKKVNKEGVQLKGYYLPKESSKCVVSFAGFAGNCDNLFCNILETCDKNDVGFLFGNTKGCYETKDLKVYLEDGTKVKKTFGACFEDFDSTIDDMIFWIEYVKQLGYKEIYLVVASISCNKVVKLLNQYQTEEIKKVVILCPQDISPQLDKNMLKEAEENMNNNEPEKVLTDKLFGFCSVCSRTFYNMATRSDINNIPYLTDGGDFSLFKNINLPILGIIGTKDQGLMDKAAEDCMEIIANNNIKER